MRWGFFWLKLLFLRFNGEMSEWSNEQAWKVCILARVSRVRIPLSPLPQVFEKPQELFSFLVLFHPILD